MGVVCAALRALHALCMPPAAAALHPLTGARLRPLPTPTLPRPQARGCIIVASSPEILCRVDEQGKVTNRRAPPRRSAAS